MTAVKNDVVLLDIRFPKTDKAIPSVEVCGLVCGELKSPWKNQVVPAIYLVHTLSDAKQKTAELTKSTDEKIEEALANTSESMVIECENTKIVTEFRLIRKSDSIAIDSEGFFIADDYMPNDEDAPERIYGIFNELRNIINEFFDTKARILEANTDKLRENILTTGRSEKGDVILSKWSNGKNIPVTGEMVSTKEAIKALHFYKLRYPYLVSKEYSNKVTTSKGKKYLSGAILSVQNGAVKFHNLEEFDPEVQDVVNDMIQYFTLAK